MSFLDVFLSVLAQVTGFLSVVILPLSIFFLKIVDLLFKKVEKTEIEQKPKSNFVTLPKPEIPPWFKEISASAPQNPSKSYSVENPPNVSVPEEKLSSSLMREVFFTEEEQKPEVKSVRHETVKKSVEKKLTLEDLLTQKIQNAQFRIKLKLPQKAKLRVLGRDWEVDTNETFIEISSMPPQKPRQIPIPKEPKEPWEIEEKIEKIPLEEEIEEEEIGEEEIEEEVE